MKIIQVATLISPSGAFGGPVRVAVNQTRALLEAGHEVVLAAGATGFGARLPTSHDGVPVTLFRAFRAVPKAGFSSLLAPGLQTWLKTALKSADIVHIHLGRDLVTLPAARQVLRRKVPYVLQTHGMIAPSDHPLAGTVDRLWTSRALNEANRIFYLTPEERQGLSDVATVPLNLQKLLNGVPQPDVAPGLENDPPVEVLFLARMHHRKRPQLFVSMAKALHSKYPHVRFSLVGPDEGEGPAVSAAIKEAALGDSLRWEGAIRPENTAARINQSAIYVLPSVDEPFGMSVLEALSLGKPVVVTDSCGLAGQINQARAGTVVDSSLESLISGVDRLLADPQLRKAVGAQAQLLATQKFGMETVRDQLANTYFEVLGGSAVEDLDA